MTSLTGHVTAFAQLLAHHLHPGGKPAAFHERGEAVTGDDLPAPHSFVQGLDKDRAAVQSGLDLPYSNEATEGNNVKLLQRQTHGRAGFALLRQRIPPSCTSATAAVPDHRLRKPALADGGSGTPASDEGRQAAWAEPT
jgi:hypothetical protein